MKRSQKWFALIFVCGQCLASLPVSAAAISSDSDDRTHAVPSQVAVSETRETEAASLDQPENSAEIPVDTKAGETEPSSPVIDPEDPAQPAPETPQPSEPETPKPTEPESPEPETTQPSEPETPKPTAPENSQPAPEGGGSTQPQPEQSEKPIPAPLPSPDAQPEQSSRPSQPDSSGSSSTGRADESAAIGPSVRQPSNQTEITIQPVKEVWAFIQEIGEDARELGLKNDLYASIMIAQAILESGGGQSRLSQAPYYNLFGIKGAYEGQSVTFETKEDDGSGTHYSIQATFRQYQGYKESLLDYTHLLKKGLAYNPMYYQGAWKSLTTSYKEATAYLTGRYATDTHYGEKLNALIEAYALTRFDQEKADLPQGSEAFIFPVEDAVVSSNFGSRWGSFHRGVDFASSFGTPIAASQSGTVIRSEVHPSWGNYVAIQHENGLTTLYAHNQQNLVKVGQHVQQGELIALMGSTGNSTGPHLHFEVSLSTSLQQDQLIDPLEFLTR